MKYENFEKAHELHRRIENYKFKIEELKRVLKMPQYYSLLIKSHSTNCDITLFGNDEKEVMDLFVPYYIKKLEKEHAQLIVEFEALE